VADVLPLAIAIAASPFPVIPAILLLFTPRARATASAFLAGWLAGVALLTAVFVMVADLIELLDEPPMWLSWTRIGLGAALLVWGAIQWRGRKTAKDAPAWMDTLETAGPSKATRLALLLSAANPKIIILAAAGGLTIGTLEYSPVGEAVAVVAFALVGSVSVAVPVLGFLLLGDRVLGPLGKARDWLQRNNAAIMAAVFVVLGIALLVKGLTSL
jgi:hypothetical protein